MPDVQRVFHKVLAVDLVIAKRVIPDTGRKLSANSIAT